MKIDILLYTDYMFYDVSKNRLIEVTPVNCCSSHPTEIFFRLKATRLSKLLTVGEFTTFSRGFKLLGNL